MSFKDILVALTTYPQPTRFPLWKKPWSLLQPWGAGFPRLPVK